MNKYYFKIDALGDYKLCENDNNPIFTPRTFAQKFFYKEGEVASCELGNLIFKSGADNDKTQVQNVQRYPVVTNITPSQNTANFLKNFLFSNEGVLTQHLSYLYQSWMWGPQDQVFGDYLHKLANNDGEILNALGNVTVAFGGDPNFMTANGKNWSTQYLLSTKNREQFIKRAISMEEQNINDLEVAIPKLENESLRRLMTSIKEDKQKIAQDLKNFLK